MMITRTRLGTVPFVTIMQEPRNKSSIDKVAQLAEPAPPARRLAAMSDEIRPRGRDYIAECREIRANMEANGWTNAPREEYANAFCRFLRLRSGSTRLVEDLVGDIVEVWADTDTPVPEWFNPRDVIP